jgi:hypothetical protein
VREDRDARGNDSTTGEPGPRGREREEERVGEETGADRSSQWAASEREGAHERELPLTGEVRLSGGAGARERGLAGPSWAGLGCFLFSFSLDFLILFLFLFYRIFNSKFKLGFKFK